MSRLSINSVSHSYLHVPLNYNIIRCCSSMNQMIIIIYVRIKLHHLDIPFMCTCMVTPLYCGGLKLGVKIQDTHHSDHYTICTYNTDHGPKYIIYSNI